MNEQYKPVRSQAFMAFSKLVGDFIDERRRLLQQIEAQNKTIQELINETERLNRENKRLLELVEGIVHD